MSKPKQNGRPGVDGSPQRWRAGSHCAPRRSPGRTRAVKKLLLGRNLIGEWIGEWAGGGSVTGEPSMSLGGSVSLTLVPRERKRRDSKPWSGDNYRSAERCGLT